MKNLLISIASTILSTPSFATDAATSCTETAEATHTATMKAATEELEQALDRCGMSMHPATDRCYQIAGRRFEGAEQVAQEQLLRDLSRCE